VTAERADLGPVTKAGQPARIQRAQQRTREHAGDRAVAQSLTEPAGLDPAFVGEGDVGPAGVAQGRAPLRLSVAREQCLRGGYAGQCRAAAS